MARIACFLRIVLCCGVSALHGPAFAEGLPGALSAADRDRDRVTLPWKDVPRWADVLERARAEQIPRPAGSGCEGPVADTGACRLADWHHLLNGLRDVSRGDAIGAVHRAVNALPYVSDMQNWGMADRWATPEEMFTRGGDCEDYALTKFFALRDLGVPVGAMQLAIVWDREDSEQHAVLFVESDGRRWMLDNKFTEPMPADAFADRYRIIYSVGTGGATFSPAALATRPGRAPRLSENGRMLVFSTRPVRRTPAVETVQMAAIARRAPAPILASPAPQAAFVSPAPSWKRALAHSVALRPVRYWFASETSLTVTAIPYPLGSITALPGLDVPELRAEQAGPFINRTGAPGLPRSG